MGLDWSVTIANKAQVCSGQLFLMMEKTFIVETYRHRSPAVFARIGLVHSGPSDSIYEMLIISFADSSHDMRRGYTRRF